jgi:hypothetical protein
MIFMDMSSGWWSIGARRIPPWPPRVRSKEQGDGGLHRRLVRACRFPPLCSPAAPLVCLCGAMWLFIAWLWLIYRVFVDLDDISGRWVWFGCSMLHCVRLWSSSRVLGPNQLLNVYVVHRSRWACLFARSYDLQFI